MSSDAAVDRHNSKAIQNLELINSPAAEEIEQLAQLFNQQQYGEVERIAKSLVECFPEHGFCWKLLGASLKLQGRGDEALGALKKAASLLPDDAESHSNLGAAQFDLGLLGEAERSYSRALQLNPDFAEVHNNAGALYKEQTRYVEAEAHFRRAIAINPNHSIAYYNLAGCLRDQGHHHEAREFYQAASEIHPEDARFRVASVIQTLSIAPQTVATANSAINDFDCALNDLAQWAESSPDRLSRLSIAAGSQQPYFLAYRNGNHVERLSRYGDLLARTDTQSVSAARTHRKKMRLAVVSQHFHRHSVWDILIRGLLVNLDRNQFEVALYYTGSREDRETALARSLADIWREQRAVGGLRGWVGAMKADLPDAIFYPEIAMDPTTCNLAAQRLAPLQIAGWGHPITTGLPTIDIYVSGELIEPPQANTHYRERLVRLPGTGCCTAPIEMLPNILPEISGELNQRSGVRFLVPHRAFKFDPCHDAIYLRIALGVGKCTFIFLKDPIYPWATEQFVARLSAIFRANELNPESYILVVPWLSREHFLGLLDISDIYLDCPSFSGYTTAWQAAQRGLPIVTLEGEFMRQRLAAGLLRQTRVTDTITQNKDEYVSTAIALAAERRADMRWSARREAIKRAAPLMNHNLAAIRAFEQVILREFREKT